MNQPEEKRVGLDKLFLDTRNPRFASYFNRSASQTTEDSAISHLIRNAAVVDLAESIKNFGGLYYGESIHCIKKENSENEFIVLEGNRRISACKLLNAVYNNNSASWLTDEIKIKFSNITQDVIENISHVSAVIYDNLEMAQPYIVSKQSQSQVKPQKNRQTAQNMV